MLSVIGRATLLCLALCGPCWGGYSPTWPSLDGRPLPDWYDEAKIGIFMHFGVYSTTGNLILIIWSSNIGLWNNIFRVQWCMVLVLSTWKRSCLCELHERKLPSKLHIPRFWTPTHHGVFQCNQASWSCGKFRGKVIIWYSTYFLYFKMFHLHFHYSRYLVFTSKHHDGFTNWPSSYTFGWNSVDIGPRRDVLTEIKDGRVLSSNKKLLISVYQVLNFSALGKTAPDVKFGLYYSLYEWFHPLYLKDKSMNYTTR